MIEGDQYTKNIFWPIIYGKIYGYNTLDLCQYPFIMRSPISNEYLEIQILYFEWFLSLEYLMIIVMLPRYAKCVATISGLSKLELEMKEKDSISAE